MGRHFRPGQLIADNTSIKTQPVEAMLAAVPEGVEVLGMHTIFGPRVESLRHQNIVFTRTPASGPRAKEFEDVFYKHGATITYTTPQYHDKQMAFHQNLEHFTKVALAQVLHTHFSDPTEMDRYSSPNSRTSLAVMGRILRADPDLYSEIQSYNLQGPDDAESLPRRGANPGAGDERRQRRRLYPQHDGECRRPRRGLSGGHAAEVADHPAQPGVSQPTLRNVGLRIALPTYNGQVSCRYAMSQNRYS